MKFPALPWIVCWSVFVLRAAAEFPNRVEESELPRGEGLAAAFSRDAGIGEHEAVIFADDFEEGGLEGRWDEAVGGRMEPLALTSDVDEEGEPLPGGRFLRVTATLGENEGGGLTRWFESADTLFVRFYTRFDEKCDYVHHFVTLRANRGLRGADRWSGFGGAGRKPEGDDRFSTALEPAGDWGRLPPPGVWSFYSYWMDMEPSRDGRYWGNAFRPEAQEPIARGSWICAEFMLKHNTPGEADGEQAFWIDGRLVGHWTGIRWRSSAGLRANALSLESYVTDRWTENRVNVVDFDQVVVARSYIGPAGR